MKDAPPYAFGEIVYHVSRRVRCFSPWTCGTQGRGPHPFCAPRAPVPHLWRDENPAALPPYARGARNRTGQRGSRAPDDLHLLAPAESDSDASVSELLPSTNRRAAYPLFSVVVIKGILSFNKRIYRAEGGGGVMRGRSSGKTAPPRTRPHPGRRGGYYLPKSRRGLIVGLIVATMRPNALIVTMNFLQ